MSLELKLEEMIGALHSHGEILKAHIVALTGGSVAAQTAAAPAAEPPAAKKTRQSAADKAAAAAATLAAAPAAPATPTIAYSTVSDAIVELADTAGRDVAVNILAQFKGADGSVVKRGPDLQAADYPEALALVEKAQADYTAAQSGSASLI